MALPPKKKRRLSPIPPVGDSAHSSDASKQDSNDSWGNFSPSDEDDDVESPINGDAETHFETEYMDRELPSRDEHEKPSYNPSTKTKPSPKSGSVNLFEFQVENLIRQTQPKSTSNSVVDDLLRKLKPHLEGLPDRESSTLDKAEKSLLSSKIVIPFPSPRPPVDAKYKFGFQKPTYINVIGSYALKTATRSEESLCVDLLLQMPSVLFTEKDYLNYRYFHKRAFYLACIAEGIQTSEQFDLHMSYSFLNGNHLLPVLVLQPVAATASSSVASKSNWKVQVLLAVDKDLFPKQKTLPNKNCVRSSQSSEDSQYSLPPTPFYNCSLRVDCSMTAHLKLLHEAAILCNGFRQACHLGRIWLAQRGFSSDLNGGGFGHFEWAVLMAILLQGAGSHGRRVLSPSYNAQQLFRAMVQFLGMKNLSKQPLPFQTEVDLSRLQSSDPLVLEGLSGSNLLYKMTPWSYDRLRQEAQNTVKTLSSNSPSKFESIFILKVSEQLMHYDMVAIVTKPNIPSSSFVSYLNTLREFYDFLTKGLTERVVQLSLAVPPQEPWPIHTTQTGRLSSLPLTIQLVIDPVSASRTVDRGPAAEDSTAASKFQQFWGDKAELRRFKDGQILQSVVWSGNGPIEITQDIITYLVKRQFGEKSSSGIQFYGNDPRALKAVSQSSSVNLDFSKAYLNLEQQIRTLEGLPLQVRQIQRSTITSNNKHPIDVVLQFEESGRWPDDLEAIQMTKVAFLLKLEDLLGKVNDIEGCRIGLENEDSKILNRSFLDVTYAAGGVFRIRIHHDREQTLIERIVSNKTLLQVHREEAAAALSAYKRTFIRKPIHTQSMTKILTRFPALNETLHLVKAWFGAHLLSNHFRSEFIELITAATFLDPLPWSTPSSAQTGFLRTLLFISKWDWQDDPLIVDFSSSMTSGQYEGIRTRLEAWRKVDPLINRLALFVASDFDPEGEIWTENAPSKLVAARMVSLAKAACKMVKEKGIALDLPSLFKKSLNDYDFIFKLSNSVSGRRKTKSSPNDQFKNLQIQKLDDKRDVGYDPVQLFLAELQALYGDSVVFFHGDGSDVIAGLWSPHTARRAWKFNLAYSTIPLGGEDKDDSAGADVLVNKRAMLAEMARLGDDMIVDVEYRR